MRMFVFIAGARRLSRAHPCFYDVATEQGSFKEGDSMLLGYPWVNPPSFTLSALHYNTFTMCTIKFWES